MIKFKVRCRVFKQHTCNGCHYQHDPGTIAPRCKCVINVHVPSGRISLYVCVFQLHLRNRASTIHTVGRLFVIIFSQELGTYKVDTF